MEVTLPFWFEHVKGHQTVSLDGSSIFDAFLPLQESLIAILTLVTIVFFDEKHYR